MKLRHIGFYRDVGPADPDSPLLRELVSKHPPENLERVVSYLDGGQMVIACLGVVRDPIDDSHLTIGTPSIVTDGVWAWPEYLSAVVRKYNVRLPDDFLLHMESNEWKVPCVDVSKVKW
jgi:hypothetical protein